jgi:hypothetical protein
VEEGRDRCGNSPAVALQPSALLFFFSNHYVKELQIFLNEIGFRRTLQLGSPQWKL